MKNGDLILILILTIIFSFTAHENTQLYIILIGALILLAGYSIKSVLYPSDHGKQNILSLLVTTLLTILITVVFLRFMGKTYLIPMLASIVIICVPLAFLRKRPKKENDLDIYKTGDKALKEYLGTVNEKSNKKSLDDEIIIVDRKYSEVKDNEKPQEDRETEETEKLPETEEQSYEVPNVAENRFLVCERCGGYYKLKEWESPEDFESCQCGGDLHYEAYKEESATDKPDERNLDNLKGERNEHENPILGNIRKVIQETEGGTIQKTEEPDPDLDPVSRQTKRFIPYDMVLTFIFAGLCFLFLSVPSFSHMGKTLGTILMVFFPGYAIVTIIY
ncbi:MAG: hypothetical protein K8E24_012630, partial [Methanobacterium paludis]|nr:hypothetical protein [Methanobacterium paludis]